MSNDHTSTKTANKDIFDKEYPIIQYDDAYYVFLFNYILDSHNLIEVISLLKQVDSSDRVVFMIDSDGGYMRSAIALRTAILETEATTVAHVAAEAASAATTIALSCDELYIDDHGRFMCHAFSSGTSGKDHEVEAHVQSNIQTYRPFFYAVYEGFMSNDEIDRMIRGEDFWFSAEETRTRWARLTELKKAEAEKEAIEIIKSEAANLERYLDALKSQLPKDVEEEAPKRKRGRPRKIQ